MRINDHLVIKILCISYSDKIPQVGITQKRIVEGFFYDGKLKKIIHGMILSQIFIS